MSNIKSTFLYSLFISFIFIYYVDSTCFDNKDPISNPDMSACCWYEEGTCCGIHDVFTINNEQNAVYNLFSNYYGSSNEDAMKCLSYIENYLCIKCAPVSYVTIIGRTYILTICEGYCNSFYDACSKVPEFSSLGGLNVTDGTSLCASIPNIMFGEYTPFYGATVEITDSNCFSGVNYQVIMDAECTPWYGESSYEYSSYEPTFEESSGYSVSVSNEESSEYESSIFLPPSAQSSEISSESSVFLPPSARSSEISSESSVFFPPSARSSEISSENGLESSIFLPPSARSPAFNSPTSEDYGSSIFLPPSARSPAFNSPADISPRDKSPGEQSPDDHKKHSDDDSGFPWYWIFMIVLGSFFVCVIVIIASILVLFLIRRRRKSSFSVEDESFPEIDDNLEDTL